MHRGSTLTVPFSPPTNVLARMLPALPEVHDVTREGTRFVAEDVLHPAKVFVELARPYLKRAGNVDV